MKYVWIYIQAVVIMFLTGFSISMALPWMFSGGTEQVIMGFLYLAIVPVVLVLWTSRVIINGFKVYNESEEGENKNV